MVVAAPGDPEGSACRSVVRLAGRPAATVAGAAQVALVVARVFAGRGPTISKATRPAREPAMVVHAAASPDSGVGGSGARRVRGPAARPMAVRGIGIEARRPGPAAIVPGNGIAARLRVPKVTAGIAGQPVPARGTTGAASASVRSLPAMPDRRSEVGNGHPATSMDPARLGRVVTLHNRSVAPGVQPDAPPNGRGAKVRRQGAMSGPRGLRSAVGHQPHLTAIGRRRRSTTTFRSLIDLPARRSETGRSAPPSGIDLPARRSETGRSVRRSVPAGRRPIPRVRPSAPMRRRRPSWICSVRMRSSSPAAALSKKRLSRAGPLCGCWSSRSAVRRWSGSCSMPPAFGSRSSRWKGGR